MAAHGPGTVLTGKPAATTAATSGAPGSLISGVPASLTSATETPARSRATTGLGATVLVVLVQRPERVGLALDTAGVQQLLRMARVLGEQQLGTAQHVERTAAQVTQVADRRGDEPQRPGRQARIGLAFHHVSPIAACCTVALVAGKFWS